MISITGNSFMQILGIHWDQPYFRTAHVRFNRQGVEILHLDSGTKPLYKTNFRGKIITGLPAKDLLIRSFTLNIQKQKHLEQALKFQSETTSHLPQEEVLSTTLLYENKQDRTTEVLSITALRHVIRNHLQFYTSFEIEPHRISGVPQALFRYALWKHPGLQKGLFIDLGSSEWSCMEIDQGRLKKSFSLIGGIEELLQALWEDRKKTLLQKEIEGAGKQIDLLQLKPHLNPHLHETLLKKRQELAKAIYSLSRESSLLPVFFTGRTGSFVHIREYLLESLKDMGAEQKELPPPVEEDKYAISIGLSLEETEANRQSVQFLQEEFFPKKNWKKAGLFSFLLIALSLLGACSLFFWGEMNFSQKEKKIVQSIEQVLSRHDPAFRAEIFQENLSAEAILDAWESALEKADKQPSYTITVPKVSEALMWLSSHPLLQTFAEEGEPLEWEDIRYRLVQFPKIGSSQESYKAQVELSFRVKHSTQARKFHEALLKGDNYVDPKEPIGWETLPQGYKTTFFLKQGKRHDF